VQRKHFPNEPLTTKQRVLEGLSRDLKRADAGALLLHDTGKVAPAAECAVSPWIAFKLQTAAISQFA
jgi:hypothetical protein